MSISPRGITNPKFAKNLWNFSGRDGVVEYWISRKGKGRRQSVSGEEAGFLRENFRFLDQLTGLSFVEQKSRSKADIRITSRKRIRNFDGLTVRRNGWFDVYWQNKSGGQITDLEKWTIRHEIGHAIGLDHPFGNGANLKYNTDDTIMSYIWTGSTDYTSSDRAALTALWGG
ncbi:MULTISPECIES: reprolysin-like metallopeptidase [Aphanothece]|uniref:reprolysin-like metallopeptidase n=1 Tax=Aphanothece TaxID=1121 RepID=UPI00398551B6